MNKLAGEELIDAGALEREIAARDREIDNTFTKDAQVTAIRGARTYLGDKLIRVAKPHRLLDPANGPLIAVRLWILTRKTLGGLATDLSARVLKADGTPLGNVYAAGEVAGFGGGGMHGYRALEGTFLGGCIFSGRTAGRAAAARDPLDCPRRRRKLTKLKTTLRADGISAAASLIRSSVADEPVQPSRDSTDRLVVCRPEDRDDAAGAGTILAGVPAQCALRCHPMSGAHA